MDRTDPYCTLCGAHGHTAPHCPWQKRYATIDGGLPEEVAPETEPKLRSQSKLASLVESVVNTLVGLVIAMGATFVICWAYSIPMTLSQNFILTSWMTVISVLRGYVIRRLWNAEFWKSWGRRNESA